MAAKKEWWKPEPAWPVPENKGKDVVLTGAKLIDGNVHGRPRSLADQP